MTSSEGSGPSDDRLGSSPLRPHLPRATSGTHRRIYKAQRPRVGRIALVLLVTVALVGAVAVGVNVVTKSHKAAAPPCRASAVLSGWPLQRLADQTIVVPAEQTALGSFAPAARAGYAGLLLFGSKAPADLSNRLGALRRLVPAGLGWLVMTDEEGGGVQHMANLAGSLPWARQLARRDRAARIGALARAVGRKMLVNGVGADLAPVLDVDGRGVVPGPGDPDGLRSFSGRTSVVTTDGVAFMKGMLEAGVIPVVKHFPGLGGVSRNTDDGPAWTLPWRTLQGAAIPPFAAAIAAGAPAVMMSNARVLGFTDQPASLSPKPTRYLRDNLHFKGLIVTDSLSALAISEPPEALSVPAASVRSLQAGDDLILFGPTGSAHEALSLARQTSAAIVTAVDERLLPLSKLVAADAAVLSAKKINVCTLPRG